MACDVKVAEELAAKFATEKDKNTPYVRWVTEEGLDIIPAPARYLAFKHFSPRNPQGVPLSWISRRSGGNQIDYADEDPKVRSTFADALAKHGLSPRMDEVYQKELATLPPQLGAET